MPVTLITGTSSGIGFAAALHLAHAGHTVYATMRDPDRGGPPLREAAAKHGVTLRIQQLDVTDAASCDRAVAAILAEAGQIDVLVNNAGVGELSVLEKTTDDQARRMYETNVIGPLRLIRLVLPGMRDRRTGTIVNISSVAGRVAPMCHGLYSGSKHALEAMSESLALEMRPFGIRVALIEPGLFKTVMVAVAAAAELDPASPYADPERRMTAIYANAQQTGGDPQVVAEAIEHAITTSEPRLRYPVGVDAPVFIKGRQDDTDEGWLEFGRRMSDAEFWSEFARRFPMPTAT
jgi:NAD(P)-dependent dehydrogenase (short-subunit alcohol dehydrogenase family)